MNARAGLPRDEQAEVLVLAPGRDGELSCRVLHDHGHRCRRCRDADDLRDQLCDEAGALLIAEEVMTAPLVAWLQARLQHQPAWSDLPILVVAQREQVSPAPARLAALGNVTLLTRPMALGDLATAVASALRARDRQFQVRRLLDQQREEARRKDEFLAMLAHELRNPLTPVRYAARALGAEAATPRQRHLTEVVERQVAHMGSVISQLLDVSRLTRGKIELDRAPLDLADLARRCAEAHQGSAVQREVRLEVDAPQPVWVDGDATRLGQVVENLLDNAIKFSPPGTRVLLEVARAGGQASLAVTDEGDGIQPADLAYVFQPFVQADRTLDRARGGLGLGLAMVNELVKLHDGEVQALSDGQGRGSRFVVTLPACDPPQEETADEAATSDGSAPDPGGQKLHVLLAEDNEDAAETLRMLLEFSGYEVRVAHSGPEAVAAARERRPDALLCDIGLPGMSGYDVARELRTDPGMADTLFMALTGYGTAEDKAAALEAGFDLHLAKPVDPELVFRELERLGRPG
ncbi:ATP-binding protein [Ramlibacter sp. XY19]|uniref:hybrid sensor histidine kinase/response regulator n=1 Tax=Ramlibacter paludis TaxID=2908000 RepID=UPI0023DB7D8B|nr:ATP-binding protein [Ramlibacter paludis]MCG2592338.1 ATP-binding protein [Ramlibacter paludis]